jgi:tetratricopeptide (TPR) repeat protein
MNNDNWRDCDAWRKQNLSMNTTSNEAAKLFDISLSQLIGYYDNKNYDGLESSLNSMIAADPDFVLGHCLKTGIELLGSNALLNSYQNKIDLIKQKSILLQPYLTKREINHVKAIDLLHQGELIDAVNIWENILIDNPTDVLALKFAHSSYFYLGNSKQMRDSVARVLPYWTKSTPYNNYLNVN